jgi:MFS family permease
MSGLSGGLNFYGFSAFFVPLSQEFGWSRTALSGVISLARLEGGFLGPLEGYLADKFGPRKVMIVGIPLMGTGFILLSQVQSLLSFYLVYILAITLGSALGTFVPVNAAIAHWFIRKRSRAFGLVMSGIGIGGAIFLPILGWTIATYGWRPAAVMGGILIWVIGLPVTAIMRHKPEQYGQYPDGIEPFNLEENHYNLLDSKEPKSEQFEPEFGPLRALRTSAFWILGASVALRALVTTGFTIHFVAMMVDRGFSLPVASSLLGWVALLSLSGRIGLSWIGDFVEKRYLLTGALLVMAVTLVAMSFADSFLTFMIILVIYSTAYGGSIVLPLPIQGDYFGKNSFATIRGLLSTVQTIGMMIGPIFAGVVYDLTESYFIAFLGFAVAAVLGALVLLFLRKPSPLKA